MLKGAMIVAGLLEIAASRPEAHRPLTYALTPFERLAREAHADFVALRRDPYSVTTLETGMVGTPFLISIPIGVSSDTLDKFSDRNLLLLLTMEKRYLRGHFGETLYDKPSFMAFKVSEAKGHGGSYIGQNGYGAKTVVSVADGAESGLAILSRPAGDFSPLSETPDILRNSTSPEITDDLRTNYWVRLEMDGPSAKRFRDDVQAVIEGKFAELSDGKLASCNSLYGAPTIDSPTEVAVVRCYVGANVTRIAFVLKSTGAVIKEWRAN